MIAPRVTLRQCFCRCQNSSLSPWPRPNEPKPLDLIELGLVPRGYSSEHFDDAYRVAVAKLGSDGRAAVDRLAPGGVRGPDVRGSPVVHPPRLSEVS